MSTERGDDREFEERLRAAFRATPTPALPSSIRTHLAQLVLQERPTGPSRGRPAVWAAAAALVVVVALAGSLLSWLGPTARPSPSASIGPSSAASPSPSSQRVTVAPWAGTFVPAALAASDTTHLVLAGATGDGIGDGVVAVSFDGGAGWYVRRLSVPAIERVAAAGATIWVTTACAPDAPPGCAGELYASTDAGASWRLLLSTASGYPTLLDPEHGWVASPLDLRAPSSYAATTNGGASWTSAAAPCPASASGLLGLQFTSSNDGWAACVGDTATGTQSKWLLATTDGGRTWPAVASTMLTDAFHPVGLLPASGQLGGISMLADGHGWLWTNRGLFASVDGGRSWSAAGWASNDGAQVVESAVLVGDGTGYALVRDSAMGSVRFVTTTNGTRTWSDLGAWPFGVSLEPSATPTPAETLRFGGFASSAVGWALTDRRLRLTDDGGRTWRTAGPPIDYAAGAPKGVSFRDARNGWLVSEDTFSSALSLWTTDDGGATWSRGTLPAVLNSPEVMGEASFDWIDATHGVIDIDGGMPQGYRDSLLVTADGGRTWSEPAMRSSGTMANGISGMLSFLTPQVGWLAGGAPGSQFWMTRDGGETWTLQFLAVPAGYTDEQGSFQSSPVFFGPSDGVVVRHFDNNTTSVTVICRTTDAGRSWRPIAGAAPSSLLSFLTATDWIAWDPVAGRLWHSTDGGRTWSSPQPSTGLKGGPVMLDPTHGWSYAYGQPDALLITSDAGATWTPLAPF